MSLSHESNYLRQMAEADNNHQVRLMVVSVCLRMTKYIAGKKRKMKNILVPCDFSKPAQEAFKFAVQIARESKADIHVLYVIDITFLSGNPNLSYSYAFNVDFLREAEKEADQKFQVMAGKYAPATLKVKFKHVVSSLIFEVQNYINTNGIDLVIMGTHGEGNALYGSNTEKIVRNSPVPVFSLRSTPSKIKSIVLPVLPDQSDENFINEVKRLQAFFQAKVHLLYVNTPLIFKSDPESTKALEQFAKEKKFDSYTINVRSDYSIEGGITQFAKEIDADMIAMATHAWKGLAHFFIGSTAEDMVKHVNIPIWTRALQ